MSDAPTGSGPEAADPTRAQAIEAGARAIREPLDQGLTQDVAWDNLGEGWKHAWRLGAKAAYDAMAPIIERASCERHQEAMVTLSAGHVRAMGEARAERDRAVELARVETREMAAQRIEDKGMDLFQVYPDSDRLDDFETCARIVREAKP